MHDSRTSSRAVQARSEKAQLLRAQWSSATQRRMRSECVERPPRSSVDPHCHIPSVHAVKSVDCAADPVRLSDRRERFGHGAIAAPRCIAAVLARIASATGEQQESSARNRRAPHPPLQSCLATAPRPNSGSPRSPIDRTADASDQLQRRYSIASATTGTISCCQLQLQRGIQAIDEGICRSPTQCHDEGTAGDEDAGWSMVDRVGVMPDCDWRLR